MFVIGLGCLVYLIFGYFIFRFYLNGILHLRYLVGVLLVFSIGCSILLEVWRDPDLSDSYYEENIHEDIPIILWWTRSIGSKHAVRKCYNKRCLFTQRRHFLDTDALKMIAFYGTNLDTLDLPLPRNNDLWALLHEESPKNNPVLLNEDFLKLFNFTSTFSRHSHFPLSTLYLDNLQQIKAFEYYIPLESKNKLLNNIAPVLYIQSDCDTLTDRDTYVSKLSEFIKIDSYGSCLNNAEFPEHLKNFTKLNSVDFLRFVSQYKFTLSVENAICYDYISEKLWRPLIVGSVPVYFGSPTVRDWAPNYDSVIVISDFNNPEELAKYLNYLNNDDNSYEKFLIHKTEGKINNERLKKIMKSRKWDGFTDSNEYVNIVDEFECQLCLSLYDDEILKKVDKNHYHCINPVSMLTGETNSSNHWNDIVRLGYCQGKVISQLISMNMSYGIEELQKNVERLLEQEEC